MLIKTFLGHCYYIDAQTHEDIVEAVKTLEGLPDCVCLRCEKDGKPLLESGSLDGTDCVTVTLAGGLPGGKGGFGSLLRSIGAQIEKTTNHEAMRWVDNFIQDRNSKSFCQGLVRKKTERCQQRGAAQEVRGGGGGA